MVFRSVRNTIHVKRKVWLRSVALICLAAQPCEKSRNFSFDLTCDVISDQLVRLFMLFGEFMYGALRCRLNFENRLVTFRDPKGAETPPPHRWVGSGNSPSGRGIKRAGSPHLRPPVGDAPAPRAGEMARGGGPGLSGAQADPLQKRKSHRM